MDIKNTEGSQESAYALEPRIYELGYHLLPSIDEGNLEEERNALVAIITQFGGVVISEEMPALINLAYPMDKIIENKRNSFSQAYFGWIKFSVNPDWIIELEEDVTDLSQVLRYLLIKTVKENTIVSETPYKLAKTVNSNEEGEDYDDVERPIAEEAKESNEEVEKEEEEKTTEEDTQEEKTEAEELVIDDLTKIEGIGPKIAEIFANNGIKTFAELSAAKIDDLRNILLENKLSSHDPKTWSKQATLAKNGKWEKLAELQDALNGGK